MLDQPASRSHLPARTASQPSAAGKIRALLLRLGVRLLARLLGTADGRTVAVMAAREFSLIIRSWEWYRFLTMWTAFCAALLAVPLLYRAHGHWLSPTGPQWITICGYALQVSIFVALARWTVGRLRRDLYTNRLDELMLTRCSPADISMGEAMASAAASLWVTAATFPACLLLSAIAGSGWGAASRLTLTLLPAGGLGVWFGMGWGLAFTLRRSSAIVPLSQWWFLGPFIPVVIAWSALGCYSLGLLILGGIPGGLKVLSVAVALCGWFAKQILWHWNPILTVLGAVGAKAGSWHTTWFTDWLALMFFLVFMMRKSMDVIQVALATLPERVTEHGEADYWIHHDVHHFTQYGESRRREPKYRDKGNPIAAFDAALGHRVYLHPFLWTVALIIYLFLFCWSMMLPELGRFTGIVAVLIPATLALLLMSGGVAVSFAWERDRHRWPALAVLPIPNMHLALGKIKGVVRPTLWVGLLGSITALILGLRGALEAESALWMALHVITFPVALAFVSAVLSLTTPTLAESLLRWAVLGAIPTLATVLPWPIGGEAGMALPFSPPLLVLLIALEGPKAELVRGAWTSLGLEIFGVAGALLILHFLLRRWTVGERD